MPDIDTEIRGAVAFVTLNRPALCNAISKAMWDALPQALDAVAKAGVRVVVFRGAGGAFAAGADLVELEELDSAAKAEEHWLSIRHALNAVAEFSLPTIAMVEGACMGGGCLLACACDLRFCEPSARFCVPVAQLGIVLDDDNLVRLVSLVGRGVALQMLLTAEIVDAERAERIGLVNGVLPAVELEAAVMKIAASIERNSADSVSATKRAVADLTRRLVAEQDQSPMIASYLSEDFRLRVSKALGRKKPS